MERHHRAKAGESRHDHLRAAAEPGEEVGLDETSRDANIGVDPLSIELETNAGAEAPDVDKRHVVSGVVIDNPHPGQQALTEHLREFDGRVPPMRPGRYDEGDICRGGDRGDLVEERW